MLLPKWLTRRYLVLWVKFNSKPFDYEQAKKALGDEEEVLSVVLSNLKKNGYLEIEINPEDSRKRMYRLKSPEVVLKDTIKEVRGTVK